MQMRSITFAGLSTLQSGTRINSERSTVTELAAKISETSIPYRDGAVISTSGRQSVTLTYCLLLHDTSREAVAAKARHIVQTFSSAKGDLLDSDMPGKKYTNAVFVSAEPLEYVSRNFTTAYMIVRFKADPIPQELNAVNERILKCAASGNITINVTNNSSYTITTSGGTSAAVSYTVDAPYKYRLVCYAENAETVLLNLEALDISQPFTMPSAAAIVIMSEGYKYVELWHDTRTGVML